MIGDITVKNDKTVWDYGIQKGKVVYVKHNASLVEKVWFVVQKFFGSIDCSNRAWEQYEAAQIGYTNRVIRQTEDTKKNLEAEVSKLYKEISELSKEKETKAEELAELNPLKIKNELSNLETELAMAQNNLAATKKENEKVVALSNKESELIASVNFLEAKKEALSNVVKNLTAANNEQSEIFRKKFNRTLKDKIENFSVCDLFRNPEQTEKIIANINIVASIGNRCMISHQEGDAIRYLNGKFHEFIVGQLKL